MRTTAIAILMSLCAACEATPPLDAASSALRGTSMIIVDPEIIDGVYVMDEEGAIGIDGAAVAARDHGDGAYTVISVDDARHGVAELDPGSGWIAFEPDVDYFGRASFGYTVVDCRGETLTGRVEVEVRNVDDAPRADWFLDTTTPCETPVAIHVTVTDVDGDALTYGFDGPSFGGRVEGVLPDVTFVPAPGFEGWAYFAVVASDGRGEAEQFVHVLVEHTSTCGAGAEPRDDGDTDDGDTGDGDTGDGDTGDGDTDEGDTGDAPDGCGAPTEPTGAP